MKFSDFEFNGKRLSQFNCTLGYIDNTPDSAVTIHSPLELNTFKQTGSNIFSITNTNYSEAMTLKLNIVKTNCYELTDNFFSDSELRSIIRWLECKKYLPLKIFYDDGSFYGVVFYVICTEFSVVRISSGIAGLEVIFTANAPYAFTEEKQLIQDIDAGGSLTVYPDSDEIGILLPRQFIVYLYDVPPNGTLVLQNSADTVITKISNCRKEQQFVLDCKNKLISSNLLHNVMHKDFNFEYPRLIVERQGNNVVPNNFSANVNCNLIIKYQGVRKVGVIG